MRGAIPTWVISGLKKDFGKDVSVKDEKDEYVDIFETDWWKEMERTRTPGNTLEAYRTRDGLTRKQLGEKTGTSFQRVYEMEKGRRGISKEMAKRLAVVFKTSPARFI
jgi:DNA-binding XRE family transcriptional regulator